jgi:hypothetical protein
MAQVIAAEEGSIQMSPLAQHLLDLDVAASALANALGRTDRAADVRRKIKELRLAASPLVLADLAVNPSQLPPTEAVKLVIDHAVAAGVDWQTLAALFNTASERRAAGRP